MPIKWDALLQEEAIARDAESHVVLDPVHEFYTGYKPNPGGQAQFWDLLGGFTPDNMQPQPYRYTCLIGGIGCLGGETLIGGVPIKSLAEAGEPFEVQTLFGSARAQMAFAKGRARLYRVRLASGREVVATTAHRFLTPLGWEELGGLRVGALVAVDDTGYGQNDFQKSTGCRESYSGDTHQCDALSSPWEAALPDIRERLDGAVPAYTRTCPCLANWDGARLPWNELGEACAQLSLDDALSSQGQPHNLGQVPRSFLRYGSDQLSPRLAGQLAGSFRWVGSGPRQDLARVASGLARPLSWIPAILQPSLRSYPAPRIYPGLLRLAPSACSRLEDGHTPTWLGGQCPPRPPVELPLSAGFSSQGRPDIWPDNRDSCEHVSAQQYKCTAKWDEVVSIEFERYDIFYDLHVPLLEHYSANGIWHHNSGKSYTGAVWAIDKALKYPRARGIVTANSYPQLTQATLVTLAEVCFAFGIPIYPIRDTPEETAIAIANSRPSRVLLGEDRAFVYVLPMTSFEGQKQTARGLQARWVWGDELAYSSEDAFNTLDGRIGRGPGRELEGCGIITTTPRGYNWLYYKGADPARSEALERSFKVIYCPTRENMQHLGEGYITSLEGNYGEGELALQELSGAFVNTMTGRLYKQFDRRRHVLEGEDANEILCHGPSERLHLCFDFNISPSVCVAFHLRQGEIHVFREWYIMDCDLWELTGYIREWLESEKKRGEIAIHGDASGRARSALSRLSAWDIIMDQLTGPDWTLSPEFPLANPPVMNRIDSVNFMCRKNRLFVHEDCVELIKDFEQVSGRERQEGIDKTDPLRTHPSDAFGYGCHTLFPYGGPLRPSAGQSRYPGVA